MTPLSTSDTPSIPVQVKLPDSALVHLAQLRHAKKMTDDEIASACVFFCLRLLLDSQIVTTADTSLPDDLYRALLDVRAERRTLLDVLAGFEKLYADGRTLQAALLTRPTA